MKLKEQSKLGIRLQTLRGPLEPIITSGSHHVDSVANAILRSIGAAEYVEDAEEESTDSDEHMETESQRLVRYQIAQMCEVSDIDEWMDLHHGNLESGESENF